MAVVAALQVVTLSDLAQRYLCCHLQRHSCMGRPATCLCMGEVSFFIE